MAATTRGLSLAHEPLDQLLVHEANPKSHDIDLLVTSFRRFGFIDPVVVDERTGKLAAGHGRLAALRQMQEDGEPAPEGIKVKGSRWLVPHVKGYASANDAEAEAALVALNRSTEAGGWEEQALLDLLIRLQDVDDGLDGLGFDHSDVDDLRALLAESDSLDDVLDEVGELDGDEANVTVKLDLPPALAAAWEDHRKPYDTDGDALGELLEA